MTPDFAGLKNKYDAQGMYDKIAKFPAQLSEGYQIGRSADLPDLNPGTVKNIVVCGLGGSAIGGDLVRTLLASQIKIPFHICRHYLLPGFVDSSSLCILSSYSGNTEETLSAYDHAKAGGAKLMAITSGGKLKEKALADGNKVITIPPGYPPRAALGFSFMPGLVALTRLGFVSDKSSEIEAAISFLDESSKNYMIEKAGNPAMLTAQKLAGKIPLIYAGQDHIDAVAVRFKGQICENSKQLAFFNFFPEFNHNELVGWGLVEPFKDKLFAIILKDKDDYERISLRMQIVAGIIREKGIEVLEFESSGPNLLARMFSIIQFGDFTSLYLALLNEIDPTPVKVIDFLKKELAKI